MSDDAQTPLLRFDFTNGLQRGSQLMLYPRYLVHRSDSHVETVPFSRITALKVAFERDSRRLGWGVALVIVALLLLAIAAPIGSLSHGAAQEMMASAQGVGRALYSLFRFIEGVAAVLPAIARRRARRRGARRARLARRDHAHAGSRRRGARLFGAWARYAASRLRRDGCRASDGGSPVGLV